MICEYTVKKFCNEDISLIENFDKALADKDQTWDCHHRREMTTSRKELLEIGEYFNRPASELIFLTKKEHMAMHASLFFKGKPSWNKGIPHTEESKLKMSIAKKGNKNRLGIPCSDEAKRKMSESNKGKPSHWKGIHLYEETKRKIAAAKQGSHWFNNGIIAVVAKSCPEGFVRGRLKRQFKL